MEAPQRQRRYHQRRRTGCATCRKRHVKCDESRPICQRCLSLGLSCEYSSLEVWRSDTKTAHHRYSTLKPTAQQGLTAIWQLPNCPGMTDPFSRLPTDMPLLSHQLFSYFRYVQENDATGSISKTHLTRAIHDPNSFRSLLLFAALHYAWNTGSLREYETTYLTHKIECIRTINDFIDSPQRDSGAVRPYLNVIATLCLVEAGIGNIDAASAHLEGLVSMLDDTLASQRRNKDVEDSEFDDYSSRVRREETVIQRYVLMCCREVDRCRVAAPRSAAPPTDDLPTINAVTPVGLMDDRLTALWVIPYFLLASDHIRCENIDASETLTMMHYLTEKHGGRSRSQRWSAVPSLQANNWGPTGERHLHHWLMGVSEGPRPSPSEIGVNDMTATTTNTSSTTTPNSPPSTKSPANTSSPYTSSWMSMSVSSGFYIYGVLGLGAGEGDRPSSGRPLRYLLRELQHDIDSTANAMVTGATSHEFWLWKVFVGGFTVAGARLMALAAEMEAPACTGSMPGGDATYEVLTAWFARRMRTWSVFTGVKEWAGARDALAAIVWPEQARGEALAAMLWEQALGRAKISYVDLLVSMQAA